MATGVIDTHVHFWDPRRLRYSWLRGNEFLARRFDVVDYPRDVATVTEAFVFVECDTDAGQSLDEIRFAEEQVQQDPRVRAIVAHAPLELGAAVEPLLEQIVSASPLARGIRRILQAELDLSTLLRSPAFIAGVRLLRQFDLHFEITVQAAQMDAVLEFVRTVPDVPMVLDHCGKPDIRQGSLGAFQRQAAELARHPLIHCKLSGLATEAAPGCWTDADLLPYIEAALQAFGPNRLLYGSDWPVCLLATSPARWLELLEHALRGCSPLELQRIFRGNANDLYRLGLP